MTNHTPGPFCVETQGPAPRKVIVGADRSLVAMLYGQPNEDADASLLAAAPEMLAALIDVIEIAQESVEVRQRSEDAYDRDTARSFQADIDRARAAIAKAEGRA